MSSMGLENSTSSHDNSHDNKTNQEKNVNDDPLHGLPRPLLLGSASFTRKLILKEMGIDYSILVRPINERSIGDREKDDPKTLVETLAKAKMDYLIQEILNGNCNNELPNSSCDNENNEWIVLTGDQVVTCNNRILEKPDTIKEAKEFVKQYGQYPCSTVGCVVITHIPTLIQVYDIHIATIYFKSSISNDASKLVDEMINMNAPILSCAGGLMIEHPLTKQYIDHIDGTEDSVMGLSKDTVLQLLNQLRHRLSQKQ